MSLRDDSVVLMNAEVFSTLDFYRSIFVSAFLHVSVYNIVVPQVFERWSMKPRALVYFFYFGPFPETERYTGLEGAIIDEDCLTRVYFHQINCNPGLGI